MQPIVLLFIVFGFFNLPIFSMEKKQKIKPLNLSATQTASIKREKKNSAHFPDKTRKYSPNRFNNSEIRRNESNLQNAYEFKKFLELVNNPIIDSRKKEFFQFRLAEHLHTQFEKFNTLAAADGEPIDAEKSKQTKEIVHNLGSNYYLNLGKHYFCKAQNKVDNAQKQDKNSEEQINLLQQAHYFGSKAAVCFKDSLEIKPSELAENLHFNTEKFLEELITNIQLSTNYQGALKVTKEAYSTEEEGKKRQVEALKTSNSNRKNMKNLQKQEYMKHLDTAEQKFIEAALKYLKAAEKILNPLILKAAKRSLEEAYKTQKLKLEENEHASINPIVGEISRRIEQGFKRIQEQEENSSSTISTESSSEHYLKSKEKLI